MNTICLESNFKINSSIKSTILDSDKKPKNKNISMYNTSIFIGGHQNLKSKRIHLSNGSRYNNTVHREITNFRNKKSTSVDKVNIQLVKNENFDQIEQIDVIKMMNVRWQNNLKESRSDLSYICKKEKEEKKINKFDNNEYIKDLLDKININYNFEENNDNPEYFILLKFDECGKNNMLIHEIISPKSIDDIKKSLDKFKKREAAQINKDNNTDSNSSIGNTKNKYKFNKKENNKENINDNLEMNEDKFSPIFILNQKDIKNLYYMIEPPKTNRAKAINYTINNFSINYITNKIDSKLRAQNKKIIQEKDDLEEKKNLLNQISTEKFEIIHNNIEEKKYPLYQINSEKFEIIHNNIEEKKYPLYQINSEKFEIIHNNNIEEKKYPLYQINSENFEIMKAYNNEIKNEDINNIEINEKIKEENNDIYEEENSEIKKSKEMKDFSQCTPLSLLQNKFSVYAVSKWIKFSVPNPESQLYISNSNIINEPKNLFITNFSLCIEKIDTVRNDNKCPISISSSGKSGNSNLKNSAQTTGKSLTFNKNKNKQSNPKLYKPNNYEMGINGNFIKPVNLKIKAFK